VGAGVNRLAADIAGQSVVGGEQEEPLGSAMLTRAQVVLLTKTGAFVAATEAAETLPAGLRLLPLARVHLWAGQFRRAIRLADAGPYGPGLGLADRYRLTILKATAALLDGTCGAILRAEALGKCGDCWGSRPSYRSPCYPDRQGTP
jgi:hypothetical protein